MDTQWWEGIETGIYFLWFNIPHTHSPRKEDSPFKFVFLNKENEVLLNNGFVDASVD
jgi:hypothetical protein